jgi:hypothetical protein
VLRFAFESALFSFFFFCTTASQAAGWVDGVSILGTDFRAWGWGCDRATPVNPVYVHIGRDDNVFLGAGPANLMRESAVGSICGGNTQHGFYVKLTIPENLLDYKSHTVHIYVVGGPTAPEKLSPSNSLVFSGIDRANPPKNPGDVLGRDYVGSYVGHLGLWDGRMVYQMTGAKDGKNPTLSLEDVSQFNTSAQPWGAVNARFPWGLTVKRCFEKFCNSDAGRTSLNAASAVASRARQIYAIGADYTVTPYYTPAREGKGTSADYWPVLRGTYRCDTYVVDSYAVLAPWQTSADLWLREVVNAPTTWYSTMRNILQGNSLPRSVYDTIKANLS